MIRCVLSVDNSSYTIPMDNVIKSFMRRKYNTHYPIHMDRRHGIIRFDLPEKDFEDCYRELDAYLHGDDVKKRLKRTGIRLNHEEAILEQSVNLTPE